MNRETLPIKSINGIYYFSGDKSISHRVALLPLLFKKKIYVKNLSNCEDVSTTLNIVKQLGVTVLQSESITILDGSNVKRDLLGKKPLELFCGNSGTTARLLCGILANFQGNFILTGDESLSKRPMKRIVKPLSLMGLDIKCSINETLPIKISSNGKTDAIEYQNKECSAQVKSAIQFASIASGKKSKIYEPYRSRDHTERLLNLIELNKSSEIFLDIPSDPSGAAYFAGAAALLASSKITLKNILLNSTRIEFFKVLEKMGAKIEFIIKEDTWEPVGDIKVEYGRLNSIYVEGAQIPSIIDELPLLAVLMSQANGVSSVHGAKELRYKETDRIACVIRELSRLGVKCKEYDDGFEIEGPKCIEKKCLINTEKDHRIAMSFSVLALKSQSGLIISDSEMVNISFPEFFKKIYTN